VPGPKQARIERSKGAESLDARCYPKAQLRQSADRAILAEAVTRRAAV